MSYSLSLYCEQSINKKMTTSSPASVLTALQLQREFSDKWDGSTDVRICCCPWNIMKYIKCFVKTINTTIQLYSRYNQSFMEKCVIELCTNTINIQLLYAVPHWLHFNVWLAHEPSCAIKLSCVFCYLKNISCNWMK